MKNKSKKVVNRTVARLVGTFFLLAGMIFFTKPQSGNAAPNDLSNAVSQYPSIASSILNSCNLCHTANIPSLNPYGAAYLANGRKPAAFGLIQNLDSDGDGFSNLQELNSLTFPGNPASFPIVPTATSTQVPTSAPTSTNTLLPTSTQFPTIIPSATNTPLPTAFSTPSATPTISSNTSTFVTVNITPSNIVVGGTSKVEVGFNNLLGTSLTSAEFTCTYNSALVEVSNIASTSLFGSEPVTVVNGPQNGSFIVAIAGSNGNKATTDGNAFTFSVKGLQVGQSSINCQTRVSTGNQVLISVPSTPTSLTILSAQGTFAGQVYASKLVTVSLNNSDGSAVGSIAANEDGTFSLPASSGTYIAVASAPGYLKAQGSVNITNGNTITFQPISLLAGDIDSNNVIDQFDAITIGINYNGSAPAAADLNNDNIINILDLEILARNYRQIGSLAWQ
ncbi:MAG: hypothetical protein U0Z26_02775 [Anaerolineales bacterium]